MRTTRLHKIEGIDRVLSNGTVLDRGQLLRLTDPDSILIGDGSTTLWELPIYASDSVPEEIQA